MAQNSKYTESIFRKYDPEKIKFHVDLSSITIISHSKKVNFI